MARKQISQTEAYRLKRRVRELEENVRIRMNRYRSGYPGGVSARSFEMGDASFAALSLADKLGCALVAKISGMRLVIYAVLKDD